MSERRKIFGEKFVDLGNFTMVALVFSQLVSDERNLVLFISGIIIVIVFWLLGYFILKEGKRKK